MTSRSKDTRGLSDAQRALGLRKGSPSNEERPPVTAFAGRRARTLDGQLDIYGNVLHPTTRRRPESRVRH